MAGASRSEPSTMVNSVRHILLPVIIIALGLLCGSCGNSETHTARNENRNMSLSGTRTKKYPGGYHVVSIGGCLTGRGVRLSGRALTGSHGDSFGGNMLANKYGAPLSEQQYRKALLDCGIHPVRNNRSTDGGWWMRYRNRRMRARPKRILGK